MLFLDVLSKWKDIKMPNSNESYKLITGKDNADFCDKITKLLDEGYELYGSPTMSFNGEHIIVGQAVIKKKAQLL